VAKLAAVFPGQGSQVVGMGKALADSFPVAKATFEEADDVLGFSISKLCFEGPEDELVKTENTQPALLTVSIAAFRVMRSEGFEPEAAAGHSLGEYSALVAADAIDFAEALRTVRLRGELMEAAVPKGQGTMAAVLGLDDEAVEALCAESAGIVRPATYNAPGQVVVAGETAAVLDMMERARARGARRVQQLNVSGPFHSPLLTGAGEALGKRLAEIAFRPPAIPVYSNVTARPVSSVEEIKDNLARQVYAPVRWVETIENMASDGIDSYVEVGPGRVLAGLIKRIDKGARLMGVESPETLKAWKEAGDKE